MQKILFLIAVAAAGMTSCSPGRYFAKSQQAMLTDTALAGAHVGISIYDPVANKYVYNYQGNKYFVPASNTKLFTCYAAMKYLGDSLVGLQYQQFSDTAINIFATGDPTFLHPDFPKQPVLEFLKNQKAAINLSWGNWKDSALGMGWSWDDYNSDYMAERSPFPIQGNTVKFKLNSYTIGSESHSANLKWIVTPSYFGSGISNYFILPSSVVAAYKMRDSVERKKALLHFSIKRGRISNELSLSYDESNITFSTEEIPFVTDGANTAVNILNKDYEIHNIKSGWLSGNSLYSRIPNHLITHTIHSQPTDSLLKPMMHRSDNFFAEQSLLMVSNEKLGYMNDEDIIDTLLKNDLKDLPQKPVWVDGSGLSRYNQFTPQDIVTLLLKIKNEFGLDRIHNILPKGNTGTLTSYYQKLGSNIFAKTGTLSGQVALSGYLICKSKKLLLFSIMVNNHNSTGRGVRRAVEKFVTGVWERN